jgi:hypothetical protein
MPRFNTVLTNEPSVSRPALHYTSIYRLGMPFSGSILVRGLSSRRYSISTPTVGVPPAVPVRMTRRIPFLGHSYWHSWFPVYSFLAFVLARSLLVHSTSYSVYSFPCIRTGTQLTSTYWPLGKNNTTTPGCFNLSAFGCVRIWLN